MQEGALDYEEAVLGIVGLIPPGQVLTYGDIAEILERGGPRQVGAVMSRGTVEVNWWRVLRADGRPPAGLEAAAVVHYLDESTALREVNGRGKGGRGNSGRRVDLRRARWNPAPAEQDKLQRIRELLAAGLSSGAPARSAGMSERDDGVEP